MGEQRTAPEVTINTSVGPVTVELYYKHAPKTCQNFFELARRGYYDGVPVRSHPSEHTSI